MEGEGSTPLSLLLYIIGMTIKLGSKMDFDADNQNHVIKSNEVYCFCCYESNEKLSYDYHDYQYHH